MEQLKLNNSVASVITVGIIFDQNISPLSKKFEYKVRAHYIIDGQLYEEGATEQRRVGFDAFVVPVPFIQLQLCVDNSIIQTTTNSTLKTNVSNFFIFNF